MEKSLSVLTAVAPDRAEFLTDAAASVAAARPALQIVGWALEWIVVVDGPPEIPVPVGADELVMLSAGRGVACARNAAQSLASGSWVMPLDADDELRGAGVAQVLDRIAADDEVGWVATNRVFVGGDRTPHWFSDRRSWAVGELAQTWSAPFLFHPNSVIARRDLSLTCGGWPGLAVNEDLGWVLRMSEEAPGRGEPAATLSYRVWAGQEVARDRYAEDKRLAFTAIEQMLNARRKYCGRSPIQMPADPGGAHGTTTGADSLTAGSAMPNRSGRMHWHHRAAMAYAEAIVAQPDLNAEHQAVLMALASAHGRCGLAFAHRDTAENITTTEAVLAQALAAAITAGIAVPSRDARGDGAAN